MLFEQELQHKIFSSPAEKTYIDKVLAKDDIAKARDIIKKPKLSREDISELMYIITSTEAKLVNLNDWDRYVLMKYFAWFREVVKINELMLDFEEKLSTRTNVCKACYKMIEGQVKTKPIDICACEIKIPVLKISKSSMEMLYNIAKMHQHNLKYMFDLYSIISRTTLSLGGSGFLEILKNRYEIDYTQKQTLTQNQEKKGWFSK